MPTRLSKETILEQWGEVIPVGAGHAKDIMRKTERLIIDAKLPGVITRIDTVSTGMFSTRREFLIVTNSRAEDYVLFISARDYGTMLDVSWFLTLRPGFLKRSLSKAMTGNPQAFSMQVDMFV